MRVFNPQSVLVVNIWSSEQSKASQQSVRSQSVIAGLSLWVHVAALHKYVDASLESRVDRAGINTMFRVPHFLETLHLQSFSSRPFNAAARFIHVGRYRKASELKKRQRLR